MWRNKITSNVDKFGSIMQQNIIEIKFNREYFVSQDSPLYAHYFYGKQVK